MLLMTAANKITMGRFFLSILYLGILTVAISRREEWSPASWNLALLAAFVLFLVAAATDWVDGYVARKYGQVTHFGRIADPFVDKIIICGSLTFFLSIEPLTPFFPAWLVAIVLGREFLVHGIRSVAEAEGIEFGANFLGKLKFVVQAVAVGTALWYASYLHGIIWVKWLLVATVVATGLITVVSGMVYVIEARKLFTSDRV